MKLHLSLALLCTAAVWAQAPAGTPAVTAPSTPAAPSLASVLNMPDDATYATANGKKITAGEVKRIVQKIPAQQLPQVEPKELLLQMVMLNQFAAEALNQKLDQRSPTKEALEGTRNQVLASAYVNEVRTNGVTVTPEELQKKYDTEKNRYEQARIKMIYFAFSNQPSSDPNQKKPAEAEAKAKAEAVLKDLRAGGDFVKAVKENSDDAVSKAKDGDYPQPLKRTDQLPEVIKTAVFSLKPGQVSDVVAQPNGFYIFRAEEIGVQPFEKVRDQVSRELKEAKFQEWLQKTRSSIQITFEPAPAASPTAAAVK